MPRTKRERKRRAEAPAWEPVSRYDQAQTLERTDEGYAITVGDRRIDLPLQQGPGDPNGTTLLALVAIVQDQLRRFEAGELPCEENVHALNALGEAAYWLRIRARTRIERGIEGIQKE